MSLMEDWWGRRRCAKRNGVQTVNADILQTYAPTIAWKSAEHISSGDLLRVNIASKTQVGLLAEEQMKRGGLVSDDIMIALINQHLERMNAESWLLDGFPRTLGQAQALDANLQGHGKPLNLVVNLDVPEEVILQRIIDRWVHIPSGRVYNLSYNPPRNHGLDDVTNEPLSKRPDDNPEIFKVRLDKYKSVTRPLLDYYHRQGILVSLKGRTSDEIYPLLEAELWRRFLQADDLDVFDVDGHVRASAK
ncbi:hypothetical protein BZG36_02954 [Bifiguratus adelaidae]|uniref:Adenylate kinase active site lid domain-containing protein n=1 Tax=Bifiguratus adelaidae TaxID=1938954 RepID=A0A261Y0S8_9FUNG|nr:hypothetical protein BZG36_02954 [Bifiguratus adelaidae]